MKNVNLIKELSNTLTPVKPVRAGLKEVFLCLGALLLTILLGLVLSGVREDLIEKFTDYHFLTEAVILLIMGLFSTVAALRLSIPGAAHKLLLLSGVTSMLIWVTFVGSNLFQATTIAGGAGLNCLRHISLFATIPAAILIWRLRKGAPLDRYKASLFTFLGAASLGAFATHLICHNNDPLHVLQWHVLTVLAICVVGIFLKNKVLQKI